MSRLRLFLALAAFAAPARAQTASSDDFLNNTSNDTAASDHTCAFERVVGEGIPVAANAWLPTVTYRLAQNDAREVLAEAAAETPWVGYFVNPDGRVGLVWDYLQYDSSSGCAPPMPEALKDAGAEQLWCESGSGWQGTGFPVETGSKAKGKGWDGWAGWRKDCVPKAKYWRVANAAKCTWRPAVPMMWMRDASGATLTGRLICSGYDQHVYFQGQDPEREKQCSNAVDGSMSTTWRPQVHAPEALFAWIGYEFDTAVAVSGAEAVGLGVGEGGHQSWDGGVVLQRSHDGVTWATVVRGEQGSDYAGAGLDPEAGNDDEVDEVDEVGLWWVPVWVVAVLVCFWCLCIRLTICQRSSAEPRDSCKASAPMVEYEMGPCPAPLDGLNTTMTSARFEEVASCAVCFGPQRNAAIVPCGHRFCISCAHKVSCCPLCRGPVDRVLRLH